METDKKHSGKFLHALFGYEKLTGRFNRFIIILLHAAGWILLFILPLLFFPFRINDNKFYLVQFIDKIFLIGFFYLNYYVLIPKFFEQKKKSRYFIILFLCFISYAGQQLFIRYHFRPLPRARLAAFQRGAETPAYNESAVIIPGVKRQPVKDSLFMMPVPFEREEKKIAGIRAGLFFGVFSSAGSSFLLVILMGGFIRLAYSFIRNQNEKKQLENANLNAEVNLLKSQINPHFLFNSLNSIYSLAHNRSDQTEQSVLKLSDLLRYVLYDSSEQRVALSKDIAYITNYIDLQKLRLSNRITVNYEVTGYTEGHFIAPLLLITFIENAFKHGISYSKPSTIYISIGIIDETLTLFVKNPVTGNNSFAGGGIGLKNVQRRIELLYPGKHSLDRLHSDHIHSITLKLNLKSD